MIFSIGFFVVGIIWIILIVYFDKSATGIIKQINRLHPLKSKRNSWELSRQISKIQKETKDQYLKQLADKYAYYSRMGLVILVIGLAAMLIIGFLNVIAHAMGN